MSNTLNADVDDFLEHYGVLGMKWGVRRDERQLARASKKGHKKADKLSSKVKKREAGTVKQKESVVERQTQIDRISAGKLETRDMLELIGNTTYITLAGAAVNRQSVRKQYAQDQQTYLEGYKKGVAKREVKTKEMRNEARSIRRGANEADRQLAKIRDEKLP